MPRRMESLEELRETFEMYDDWMDKYRLLIEMGQDLPEFPESDRLDQRLVTGCQSKVWLKLDDDGSCLFVSAISEAQIVRGLIAMLVLMFNGQSYQSIVDFNVEALFLDLGLRDHLTPSRSNGFFAMVNAVKGQAQAKLRP